MIWWILIGLAVVLVGAAVLVRARRARPDDGVAMFRRQIDALSPEARRTVVDQVSELDDRAADDEPPEDHDRGP